MNKIKMGWSEVDITPKKGTKIGLAGQFFERITDEVESPITVTAFALESGDDQMVIVSCDLVAIGANVMDAVRENLKGKIDLPLDKIIISAIHSHTSMLYERKTKIPISNGALHVLKEMVPPEMAYQPLVSSEDCLSPKECLNIVVNAISQAVIKAWTERDYGYYQNAFGRAVVGMNRRVCYDDGSAKMWVHTHWEQTQAAGCRTDAVNGELLPIPQRKAFQPGGNLFQNFHPPHLPSAGSCVAGQPRLIAKLCVFHLCKTGNRYRQECIPNIQNRRR